MQLKKSQNQAEIKISPQLKKFQRLSLKLKQEKALLQEWETAQKTLQVRAMTEMAPCYAQLRQIHFEQIEQLLAQKKNKLSPTQLNKIEEKSIDLALSLLSSKKMSTQQVEFLMEVLRETNIPAELYQQIYHQQQEHTDQHDHFHADDFEHVDEIEPDSEDREEMSEQALLKLKIEEFKQLMCAEYGLDMSFFDFDYDLNDPDDFINTFKDKMTQFEQQEMLNQFDDGERIYVEREMQRENAKKAKKMQQREAAKKIANQSLKTIYLKIAALVHPDREQDEHRKSEKTELFQQLNQAYQAKDLLTLLEMQVELGQDQHTNLATEQLKAYNIILEEQIEKVADEVEDIVYSFDWDSHISPFSNRKIKVKDLYLKYEKDWAQVQQQLERSKQCLEYYKDLKMLKQLMRSGYTWELY